MTKSEAALEYVLNGVVRKIKEELKLMGS